MSITLRIRDYLCQHDADKEFDTREEAIAYVKRYEDRRGIKYTLESDTDYEEIEKVIM